MSGGITPYLLAGPEIAAWLESPSAGTGDDDSLAADGEPGP